MVSKWPSNTVTAESVKQKIDESLRPDNQLSIIEKNNIKALYKKVDTDEWKKEVKAFINKMIVSDAKNDLLSLVNNVEIWKKWFSMETLAEHSNSKFFNIILKKPVYREYYSSVIIWSIIMKNIEFFPNGHDSLDIVYWKKITDEIWVKSAWWMLKDKVAWFFTWIVWKVSEAWTDIDWENIDLAKMWDIVTKLSKIWDKEPKKTWLLIDKLKWYLDYMTKDYTKNLNLLIELWKNQDKAWLQKLLDNPVALDEVLKIGKYNKYWYNIDLENKKVSFNSNPDLVKSKTDFMKIAVDATNWNWGKLDAMKNKVKEFAWTLKKFGLDSSTLRDFRDWLKDIPLIGEFLFALVSFFLWDNVLNLMDWNPWEKEYMTSGKNLKDYIKDNKEKLPFTPWDEDFEDTIVAWEVESFLWKVKGANDTNFINIETNRKSADEANLKPWIKVSLIDNKDFWKNIFSDTEPTDNILKQLWIKAKSIKENNSGKKLSTEEFFKEMNKDLKIDVIKVIKEPTEAQKKLDVHYAKKAKELTKKDKVSLVTEIEKITKFPSVIKIKDLAWLEKELNIDFKDSKLLLNGKEFVLKDWIISEIKFGATDVILKVKDSTWIESDKKITKKQFAEIIAWLAVSGTVTSTVLSFITPKEKANLTEDVAGIVEKTRIDTEKSNLTTEKIQLDAEIKELGDIIIPKLGLEITDLTWKVIKSENALEKEKQKLQKLETKKAENLIKISELEDSIIQLEDKLEDSKIWNFLGSTGELLQKKTHERIVRNLKRDNNKIDTELNLINSNIAPLDIDITNLKTKESNKKIELNKQKASLDTKNIRIWEIMIKLGANEKELEAHNTKIIEQKDKRKADIEAERVRLEMQRKELETAQKAVEEAEKNNKPFWELLKEWKIKVWDKIENVTLDESSHTLKIGEKSYSISMKSVYSWDKEILESILFKDWVLKMNIWIEKEFKAEKLENILVKLIKDWNIVEKESWFILTMKKLV